MTQTVTIERSYATTPETLWRAWIELDRLTRWWGCAPNMLWNVHEWEPTVGGTVRVSMDFDGEPYVVEGSFLEVDEPRRLRLGWEHDQVITVTLTPEGERTRMTIEHAGLPDERMAEIVTAGWSSSVEQVLAVLP